MNPEEMREGTGGGDYPDWTKQQLMLLWFWNKLQEAYDNGESDLRLAVFRGAPHTSVRAYVPVSGSEDMDVNVHSRPVNVSDEIPELKRGGEAVAMFDRLWREEYIDVSFGGHNPFGEANLPILHNLTTKGRIDIGKFPHPDKRVAAALEAVRRSIEQDPHTPQRRQRLDALEKMISLVNNSREMGAAIINALGQSGSGGIS